MEVNLIPKRVVKPKLNKACYFILPLIGYNYRSFNNLNNVFLGDNTNKPELTFQRIFVNVYKYDEEYLINEYFDHFYKLEDNSYMFVYNIPIQFEDDYIKFCNGKYSEISELGKSLICNKSGIKPIMNSLVYKILYKTSDQKKYIEDMVGCELLDHEEVYSRPNLDLEVYNGSLLLKGTKV